MGFVTRHLGPIQLPTDHAVLFSQHICEKRVPLKDVPYIDNPDIKLSKHESVEIPMRLMKGEDGKVILAPGLKAHLRKTQDDILV